MAEGENRRPQQRSGARGDAIACVVRKEGPRRHALGVGQVNVGVVDGGSEIPVCAIEHRLEVDAGQKQRGHEDHQLRSVFAKPRQQRRRAVEQARLGGGRHAWAPSMIARAVRSCTWSRDETMRQCLPVGR